MINIPILNTILAFITNKNKHPTLPHILFLIGTYFFPQINVEVVCRQPDGSFFLTWRDDQFKNKGWHIPGGIIRPNEEILDRVQRTLHDELPFLSTDKSSFDLVGYSQVFCSPPSIRSHFFSLVFVCTLSGFCQCPDKYKNNVLITHFVPENMISNHMRYASLLAQLQSHNLPSFRQY